jgi:hypothetical protein
MDLDECVHFIGFWCGVTGAPHITLTAITPDGPTDTATFEPTAGDRLRSWIGSQQGIGRNIYFQCNETRPGCASKPTKKAMRVALCRHADIDPAKGEDATYQAERDRLHCLARFLLTDELMPPTAIIDSGNGIQPLWAIEREPLTLEIIERVENENRRIEAAVGASGTHNIDRLLRLPGTLNFPNAAKRKLGRGIARARLLLHSVPAVIYSADQGAQLGAHLAERLAGSDLVRKPEPKSDKKDKKANSSGEKDNTRSAEALRIAIKIYAEGKTFEEMVEALLANRQTADWVREKGEKYDQRELRRIWAKAEDYADKRPRIKLIPGKLDTIATAAENALISSGLPIFQRGVQLVSPFAWEVAASDERSTIATGLKSLTIPCLLDRFCRVVCWLKFDKRSNGWVLANPTGTVASVLLSRVGEWKFRPIAGVITTPTLRRDGSLLDTPGYDPATRLYYEPDPNLRPPREPIPDQPTGEDAGRALALLTDLLVNFPFVDEASRSVALSGLITPVVRGMFDVVPLHAFTAPSAGTGKSYLADLAAAVATGRICPAVAAGRDEQETEKRIDALLLKAAQIISIDNVNGELGGDKLCQAVERPIVSVRELGGSKMFDIEARATMFANGNNIRVRGDMTRRTLRGRLDANMERPETRSFSFNPFQRILENRGEYVAAALTVVRAFVLSGDKVRLTPLQSFEPWSNTVRAALVWLGRADPCLTMEAAREEDPERTAIVEVFTSWHGLFGDEEKTAAEVVNAALATILGEPAEQAELRRNLHNVLLSVAGVRGSVDPAKFGYWLRARKGRIANNLKLLQAGTTHGAARWKVVAL